jgi:membrane fusion protein, copper/silver efflux system
MSRPQIFLVVVTVAAAIAGGAFYLGRITDRAAKPAAATTTAPAPAGRKVLYWKDPMVPGQRFDRPGKSPYMDMPLQPVYADAVSDSGIEISPLVQQNLGIRTATVRRANVNASFDAIGTVQFDDRLNVAVQTRVPGYVEHLFVRAPMERVRKGQTLATLFAPDWLGPLNDIVALRRAGAAPDLLAAARERARALSIPNALVEQAEAGQTPRARYDLVAPAGGVVAELGVREGASAMPGTTLFRIAGLEKVWAVAEIPEAQAAQLSRGQKVDAALQADPSLTFAGRLAEILPQVSAGTRTLQARFEVDNRSGRLIPGMLLRLRIEGSTASRLVIPAEAVIRTGTRAVAIVRSDTGRFEPREVRLGADFGDMLEVRGGLAEGDQIVASGQFLIDSEARLRSVLGDMAAGSPAAASAPSAASAPTAATGPYGGQGTVQSVDDMSITISHDAIAALKWPAMAMEFGRPRPGAFADVKPGDRVRFEFKDGGDTGYELVSVQRLGASR